MQPCTCSEASLRTHYRAAYIACKSSKAMLHIYAYALQLNTIFRILALHCLAPTLLLSLHPLVCCSSLFLSLHLFSCSIDSVLCSASCCLLSINASLHRWQRHCLILQTASMQVNHHLHCKMKRSRCRTMSPVMGPTLVLSPAVWQPYARSAAM